MIFKPNKLLSKLTKPNISISGLFEKSLSLFPLKDLLFGVKNIINTGTSFTSGSIEAAFKQSYCLAFDGINDYVNCGAMGYAAGTTANKLRFEYKFNCNNVTPVTFIHSKGSEIVEAHIVGGKLRFITKSSVYWDTVNIVVSNGIVYDVVFESIVGQDATCFINNISVPMVKSGAGNNNTPMPIGNGNFHVGARNPVQYYFNGKIWDLKIYIDDVLKINLPMACGAGDLTCDNSGNNNHGILTNFDIATCWQKQDIFHQNISKGFSVATKGNGVNSYYRINSAVLKNYDMNDWWFSCEFVTPPVITADVRTIVGPYSSVGTDVRTGFLLYNNNTSLYFSFIINSTTRLDYIILNATLLTKTKYKVTCALNRTTQKFYIFLNDVYHGYKDAISIDPFNTSTDFYFHAHPTLINETVFEQLGVHNILNYKTGIATVTDVTDVTTLVADKAILIPEPNGQGLIDTINNKRYTPVNTIYTPKIPAQLTDPTKDILGNTLLYPAGNFHNGAETLIDFSNNGVNSNVLRTTSNLWYRTTGNLFKETTHYGVKEIGYQVKTGTSYLALSSLTNNSTANDGYSLLITNGNPLIRSYVAGVYTLVATATINPALDSFVKLKIERNQTENQYFTGEVNAFRISMQGHSVDYPLFSSSWEVLATATDNTHTSGTAYFALGAVLAGQGLFNVTENNEALSFYDFTQSALGGWIGGIYETVPFNSSLTNPFFYRKIYQNVVNVIRNDRYLIYAVEQTGSALTKILKYIKDKFL